MIISAEPIENFNKKFDAVGILVQCDGKLLLVLRNDPEDYPNTWALPGGGVDPGEDFLQAAIRELKEETGLDGGQLIEIGRYYVRYPEADYGYCVFKIEFDQVPKVKPNSEEHSDFKWFAPEEALNMTNLIPGLSEIIKANFK
ncbi:MAG: NUDIX hydrolase [Candidatus Doudnabacteria bacterium]|nr:NUDIX hydrolase [Candidatus Doudnabacteria bacterium]